MNVITCPLCGAENTEGSSYCRMCGTPVTPVDHGLESTARDVGGVANLERVITESIGSQYIIQRPLGRGGMGAVFLAEEIELERLVAIKVLPPLMTFDRGFVERFRREARTVAALDHPNIVPVHRVGEVALADLGSLLYYVMKYVDGPPLSRVLHENQSLPVPVVETILTRVSDALAHAHARGVIHRDIKPANIMLDTNGWVWVTDFGIAKAVDATALTQSGGIIGTPNYMSPEQARGRQADARTDQYSLGVVGYEMLVGEVPFSGEFFPDIMQKHCFEPLPPIAPRRPDAPAGLLRVVERLLEKDPERRFTSMDACLSNLQLIQSEEPTSTTAVKEMMRSLGGTGKVPTQVQVTPSQPIKRPRRWIKRALAGAATLAIAAAAYVAAEFIAPLLLERGQTSTTTVTDVDVGPPQLPPEVATIALRDLPPEATVQVDGRAVSGTEIEVEAGRHTIRVEAAGFIARESEVTVAEGERTALSLPLVEAPTEPPPPTTGWINVVGLPDGGAVAIDGRRRSGTNFELRAGRHIVQMSAPRWQTVTDTIRLTAGERVRLVYSGQRLAAETATTPGAQAAQPAILMLRINPWANVFIDNESLGANSRLVDTLTAGRHTLRFEREGFMPRDTTIVLQAGQEFRLDIRLTPRNQP
ncbi:MAG: protein kinase [Gemmatimonadales bacterium]